MNESKPDYMNTEPDHDGLVVSVLNRGETDLKLEINRIIWEKARPGVTLGEAERAAIAAFDAIWPLCDPDVGKK